MHLSALMILTNHIDAAACQGVCVFDFFFFFFPFCHSKKNRELLLFLFIFNGKGLLIWKIKWITDYSMCETTPNTTEDSHIVILCRYFSSLIRSTTCWTVLSPHQITWITLWERLCDSSQNCTSNYLVFRDLTKQISERIRYAYTGTFRSARAVICREKRHCAY